MHILLIEDDLKVADYLSTALRESGHHVTQAHDGPEGKELGLSLDVDVMVVDRMLPRLDGLTLVKLLRQENVETPVLFLTALDTVDERVEGLRAGGDDYLVKPFAYSELLARLESLARRENTAATAQTLVVADLELNRLTREVRRSGRPIDLTPQEYRLLEYLMQHAGHVMTRTMLLESVWHYHFDPQTNVIDVHISKLRNKIDKNFEVSLLHTIRGAGYCLKE